MRPWAASALSQKRMVGMVIASVLLFLLGRASSPGEEGRPVSSGEEEIFGPQPSFPLLFGSEQESEHGLGSSFLERGRACHSESLPLPFPGRWAWDHGQLPLRLSRELWGRSWCELTSFAEEGRPVSSGEEERLGHNLPSPSLQNAAEHRKVSLAWASNTLDKGGPATK